MSLRQTLSLLVQGQLIEAEVRLLLRFEIKLLPRISDPFRRCQTHVNRLSCSASEACRKAGPFAPPRLPGLRAAMALSDSPPGPPSLPRTAGWRAPPAGVSLSAPRPPWADRPCPLPRRTEPAPVPVASRPVRPSPSLRRAGVRDFALETWGRGLLGLTARYGPPACSPGFPRTLSRGFRPASDPAKPLVSFYACRQLHERAPSSHGVSAPKRRTEKCGLKPHRNARRTLALDSGLPSHGSPERRGVGQNAQAQASAIAPSNGRRRQQ